jgi:hypothetical protein
VHASVQADTILLLQIFIRYMQGSRKRATKKLTNLIVRIVNLPKQLHPKCLNGILKTPTTCQYQGLEATCFEQRRLHKTEETIKSGLQI